MIRGTYTWKLASSLKHDAKKFHGEKCKLLTRTSTQHQNKKKPSASERRKQRRAAEKMFDSFLDI